MALPPHLQRLILFVRSVTIAFTHPPNPRGMCFAVPTTGQLQPTHTAVQRRIGSKTNRIPRDLELDLRFLGIPRAEVLVYQDGVNADRTGSDFRKQRLVVETSAPLKIHLAPGGGWVAVVNTNTGR